MNDRPAKCRLDQLLVQRGSFPSREAAQRAIMAGRVILAGAPSPKPGQRVAGDAAIEIRGEERYVGRGAYKLEGALDHFGIGVEGLVCLDIGASTGGFTDCLLQRGAARVHALDVGHSQLAWKIRNDPRVIAREGLNCRYLEISDIGESVDLCVMDVSFISLALILPKAFVLIKPTGSVIALIKPQFELSREEVGKGGIVRDPSLREAAVEKIRLWTTNAGHRWSGVIESPITGTSGNVEFLALLTP